MLATWLAVPSAADGSVEWGGYTARPIRPDFMGDHLIFDQELRIGCKEIDCPDIPLDGWDYLARDWFECPIRPLGALASHRHWDWRGFTSLTVTISDDLYSETQVILCTYQDDTRTGEDWGKNSASVDNTYGNKAEIWVLTVYIEESYCEPCLGSTGEASYS